MIKSIGFLLAGAALGAIGIWIATGSTSSAPAAPIDIAAPADEVVEALNAQVADTDASSDEFVQATYRNWGSTDVDAALEGLSAIEQPASRRAAALALLDVLGDDGASARRIASALPALERPAFLADWLGLRAMHDPVGAFRELLAFGSGTMRTMAAEKIAAVWGAQDPEAALAESNLLPDDEATVFRRRVLGSWAREDSAALLTHLETAEFDPLEILDAISVFAAEPEGLLAVADRRSDVVGTTLQTVALTMLAEKDAVAAVDYVEAMPAGQQRDSAVQMVAMVYAMADPIAATEWVERMLPASPNARMLVAVGLAEADPARALELLGSGGATTQENQMLLGLIIQTAAVDPNRALKLAEDLAANDDAQSRTYLANLMSTWVARDAEAALGWALERESVLDPALLGNAAAGLANRDPGAAAGYVEQLPAQFRDVWITRMAGPYGRNNLDEAVNWIGQYRGQPVYEQAFTQLISQAAQSNPESAAQLLVSEPAQVQRNSVGAVATSWARQDPDAAARWAAALNDATARDQGLVSVLQLVMRQDSADEARALLEARVSDPDMRARIGEQAGLGDAL